MSELILLFSLHFQYVNWTENMRLQQNGVVSADFANFSGSAVGGGFEYQNEKYGFGTDINLLSTRASGGGNSGVISYSKGKVPSFGAQLIPRAYLRITEKFDLGFSVPIHYRQISWATETSGLEVSSGKNLNVAGTLDFRILLTPHLVFNQSLGPYGSENNTLWMMGLGYRW